MMNIKIIDIFCGSKDGKRSENIGINSIKIQKSWLRF